MRLRTLEIKGFKSFADHTQVNFAEDVIGIVGPNGCGKSNIVDAIRWVLGEQKSKELRSDKMSNVIFNGTKKRKQGGLAQVSLTFDNTKNILPTEYNVVTITRMLYRSGESEYRINDVPCRLKDIKNLFMDTGIGSDSYAIIALGMVDDLLSDREGSRRRLFEQAAGISKYKSRKKETLNKLKSTSADLERVDDLLFEIENNLKTLEKQAKRAKRYFELKEQYKDWSVNLSVLQLTEHKSSYKVLEKQISTEGDKLLQLEVSLKGFEAKLEAEKKANVDKEKALSEQQRELNQIVGSLRGKENDKKVLEQKRQFQTQNQTKLTRQMELNQSRVRDFKSSLEDYREQLQEEKYLERTLEEGLEGLKDRLAQVREQHGTVKSDLDTFLKDQQALDREIFELEKQKAIAQSRRDNLRSDIERYQIDIQTRQGESESLTGKVAVLAKAKNELDTRLQQLQTDEETRKTSLEKTREEMEELNKQRQLVNRKLDAKRNEFQLTKSLVENLEGFPESIRFLSKNKDWAKKAPLLSDLMYTDEGYRVAIENYLEPYLNYYVVQSLKDAYDAVQLLSNSQKGKAHFFVLDAFKGYEEPMTMLPNTRRAIEVVNVDAPYLDLCKYLLENVLITESDQFSQELDHPEIALISKSGNFIRRRFSLSGGSVGLFEGKKIGRKKNLEMLEKAISKFEKEEDKLAQSFFNLKDKLNTLKIKDQSQEVRKTEKELNRLIQDEAGLKARLENFESYLKDIIDKKASAENQRQAILDSDAGLETALEEKRQMSTKAKNQLSDVDTNFRTIAEQLSEASNAYNQKNIEFIKQQNKVSTIQRELSFREKQVAELAAQIQLDDKALAEAKEEIEYSAEEIQVLAADLEALYVLRKSKGANLGETEQAYYQSKGGINEVEDKLRLSNRQRQDTQMLLNSLKDKFNNLKLQLTSIGERMKVEFGISINELINKEPDENLKRDELELKVERVKHRLGNYGEINSMAVEAYDEMKERYDLISTQREDILTAKESLLETIKEIEDKATTQFLDAFLKTKDHFQRVFRSLFSEDDSCDLLLLDPENPLDSKIKIVAKPKGKRPQTIDQLSGGEKTLTATALLFSLYLLKPAPFCIFDEVDAPLDDANIGKFNKIIKEFSKDSQFIIVTHNKQTMASVDVIYGVTMQEQGVSTVVPVDFRSLQAS